VSAIDYLTGPNDEIAKSEGRGQHREKLVRLFHVVPPAFQG
jgi:hypothetical protein